MLEPYSFSVARMLLSGWKVEREKPILHILSDPSSISGQALDHILDLVGLQQKKSFAVRGG